MTRLCYLILIIWVLLPLHLAIAFPESNFVPYRSASFVPMQGSLHLAPLSIPWRALRTVYAIQSENQVAVQLTGLSYDPLTASYNVSLSISSPEFVRQLYIKIEEENGTDLFENSVTLSGRRTIQPEFSAARLKPGGEYILKVRATNWQGNLILRPDSEGGGTQGDQSTLAARSFTHSPPQTESLEFAIRAVDPDFEAEQLHIILDLRDTTHAMTYSGFIRDKRGRQISAFGDNKHLLDDSSSIIIDLPPEMRQLREEQEYDVSIQLAFPNTTEFLGSEATYEFQVGPPPSPNMIQRIAAGLASSKYISAGIVFILASTLALIIQHRRTSHKKKSDFVRPPMDHTRHFGIADASPPQISVKAHSTSPSASPLSERPVSASPNRSASLGTSQREQKSPSPVFPTSIRLQFTVIDGPEGVTNTKETIVRFPCVIGRREANINIEGDRQISRHHVKIMLQDEQIFLIDLKSRNGTFIDEQRLEPGIPFPIDGITFIRLGRHTYCQLSCLPNNQ